MNGIEIAVIVIVAVLFAAALGYIIYRKLKHKGGCDCDCGGNCASCGACHAGHEERSGAAKCPHCAEHNDD